MFHFIVFDKITEEIMSGGSCSSKRDTLIQGNSPNTKSMGGYVEDRDFYKVKDGKIIRRSEAEIEAVKDKRKTKKKKVMPLIEQPAMITQSQLQAVLKRLDALETG